VPKRTVASGYFGVGNCARIIASHMRSGINQREGIDSFADDVILTRATEVQEEITFAGSRTTAFSLAPDLAVAVATD
jgi:hypothetical protein